MSSVAIFSGNSNPFLRAIDPFNSAAADSLQTTPTVNGVRISEVQVTNASEGEFVSRVIGPNVRTGSQIIWISEILELAQSYRGAQFYLYFVSLALGICEGPIERIKRVWADGKIFYDVNDPGAGANRYARIQFYSGVKNQSPDPYMKAYNDANSKPTPGYTGLAYCFLEGLALKDFSNRIPQFNFEVEQAASVFGVPSAISALVQTIDDNLQIDTTKVTKSTKGLLIDDVQSPAETIEQLFQAYDITASGGSGVLRFLDRGSEDNLTVLADDLGAQPGTEQKRELWGLGFKDPTLDASPREVNVQYFDDESDLQKGSQRSRRVLPGQSRNVSQFDFSLTLSGEEARQIADRLLFEAWQQRVQVRLDLPPKYMEIEETDILSIDYRGTVYELRVVEVRRGFNFAIEVDAVIQSLAPGARVEITEGVASGSGTPVQASYTPPNLTLLMLDLPPLSAAEATQVGYRAGVAVQNSADDFIGADLYSGGFATGSFAPIARLSQQLTFGASITALALPPNQNFNRWDDVSTVDVVLSNGELESADAIDVLDGANFARLGSEIIAFRSATLIAANTYRLSGLLRGRRDTADHATHGAIEPFILFDSALLYQPQSVSDIGRVRYYKGVADGKDEDAVTAQSFASQGESLKPFAPGQVTGVRLANKDWQIDWVRRSRAFTRVFQQAPIQLLEPVEQYEIDILDGPTIVRTIVVTSATTVTYTEAEQIADFGTNQTTISFRIYQISAVIGRGNVAEVTL